MRMEGTAGEARTVGLCGNPNVGKSTLFNRLTGLRQHTGNWPGKTVGSAVGLFEAEGIRCRMVDIPGSYSLYARSAEEEVARDFILFGGADTLAVVCDGTCLERGLILALQIREVTGRVIVCVNLLDEAEKKGIRVDLPALAARLGVPVCGLCADSGEGVEEFTRLLGAAEPAEPAPLPLPPEVEAGLSDLAAYLDGQPLPAIWLARALVCGDESLCASLAAKLCLDPARDRELTGLIGCARERLRLFGLSPEGLGDLTARFTDGMAAGLCAGAVTRRETPRETARRRRDDRIDRILTHRVWGAPVMVALLGLILWLTVSGANVPSELLSSWLFALGERLRAGLTALSFPAWAVSAVCDGLWRTTAWVVAVMLPPMAIFFPLFTLLEDLGYLPRVAFNLDGAFARCSACGKQCLTMMMGLGCNAVGVTGCRIIDSRRERLIAVLTNSFMPCNGRFPLLIALLTLFFAGGTGGSLLPAALLTAALLGSVGMTFLASRLLAKTVLRGESSSFALELPPYRTPQIGRVLLRSLLDRTLFVLGRAVCVAAPAGLVIWGLAHVRAGGGALLPGLCAALDGPGTAFGMDGTIVLGFLLALPANEIAIPVMLMCYTAGDSLVSYGSLAELGGILSAHGWTAWTAACVLLFSLMHWPCATTLVTIRRETGSARWTLLAAALPTACGLAACFLLNLLRRFLVA